MKMRLEKIPIMGKSFWADLGTRGIKFWILEDALIGLFQGKFDTQKQRYRSEQYMKYKANDMRKFGRGKKKTGRGEKLSDYKTRNTNTNTQFVNMILTQDTLNSLSVIDSDDTGVIMGYGKAHVGKILGGKDLGRNLVGLNDKNIRKVKMEIIKEIKKRQEKIPKNIEIKVGV